MGTRRGNNEGSIEQLPSGNYRAGLMIAGRRHSVTGRTKQEVRRRLRDLHHDADRGILPPSEKLTVAEHVERWLDAAVKPSVRPRTYDTYREKMCLYVLPTLGDVKLERLTPADLQKLYGDLLQHGGMGGGALSPRTVRHVHTYLHGCLQQALKWGLVPRNVADLVTPPKTNRAEIVALDRAQVRQLLRAAAPTRWKALLSLAVGTGLRQGELLGLKWADIDFEGGSLQVRRQLGPGGRFMEPKTSRARRKVGLPPTAVEALREHHRDQLEARHVAGSEWHDEDLVFCTWQGRPLSARNVYREYRLLLQRAGLPLVSFHALRHTHASLMLAGGVHPKVVQERLGHSTVALTLDTYSHLIPSMDQDAAKRLDSLLALDAP